MSIEGYVVIERVLNPSRPLKKFYTEIVKNDHVVNHSFKDFVICTSRLT